MNKKITSFILTSIIAVFFTVIIIFVRNDPGSIRIIPGESVPNGHKDESAEFLNRADWIEKIHRAKPGTDWREIEYKNRMQKYLKNPSYSQNGCKIQIINPLNGAELSGTWVEKGSTNQAGRIVAAEYDPVNDKIYCASGGGTIFRKDFTGGSWEPLNDRINFGEILMLRVFNRFGTQRIVVATREAPYLYYSDNYGSSWNTAGGLSNMLNWGHLSDAALVDDARHTIYLLGFEWNYRRNYAQTTLYRSIDMGQNFTTIVSYAESQYGNADFFDLWAPRYGNTPCYMMNIKSGQAFFYKLDPNNGKASQIAKFKVLSSGSPMLTGYYASRMTFYLYCAGKFYSSTDNGSHWYYKSSPPEGPFGKNSLCASVNYPGVVFLGGMNLIQSNNHGATWTNVNEWWEYYSNPYNKLHADAPAVTSIRRGIEYELIGTDGGTYISDDTMRTVRNISLYSMHNSQYYSTYSGSDTNFLFAGSQDQGFQICRTATCNNPLAFEQIFGGDFGNIISSDGGNTVWTVYPAFAAVTKNAPNAVGITAIRDFNGSTYFWLPPLMGDPAGDPDVVYYAGTSISGSGSHIIKLRYASGNISATEMAFDFYSASSGGYVSAISFSPVNPNYRYALTNNGNFFYSTNGGVTWTKTSSFSGPEPHYLCGATIYASHLQLGLLYIGGSGYSNPAVYKSTNNGMTFTRADNGLPLTLVHQITADNSENYLFAATDAGPFVYSVAQSKWYDMAGSEAPDQIYWSVEFIPSGNLVRFGTYGRGIWDFRISQPAPVIAKNQGQQEITEVMDLGAEFNLYPNPSTGVFNVKFAHFTTALLKVYDSSGKVVFFEKITEPTFDLSGRPTGVYFAEFNINQKIIVKKIIIR